MECAICFDAITAQTGSTTMACKHSFHFGCLVKWFGSQADKNLHESCPCCRHEATEHERLPEVEADEESEEEESDESEEEEEDFVFEQAAAQHFVDKKETLSETAFHAYAATRIQAAWRAYLPRMAWVKHKMNVEERKDTTELVKKFQKEEAALIRQEKFHMLQMTSSRAEWRCVAASMFQRAWRGYAAGQKAIKMALTKGYKINWVFKGDHWRRSFLHQFQIWYPHDGLPPQSLEFQNHQLWTRVQAAWRAYRIRKIWNKHDGKGVVSFTMPILNAVIMHLGGGSLTYSEFRRLPPLNREAFRYICATNGARNPTEFEWRQAASACGWIPIRLEEKLTEMSTNERTTFVPRVKYSGFLEGWILSMQFCRKKRVMTAAKKIQMAWRNHKLLNLEAP